MSARDTDTSSAAARGAVRRGPVPRAGGVGSAKGSESKKPGAVEGVKREFKRPASAKSAAPAKVVDRSRFGGTATQSPVKPVKPVNRSSAPATAVVPPPTLESRLFEVLPVRELIRIVVSYLSRPPQLYCFGGRATESSLPPPPLITAEAMRQRNPHSPWSVDLPARKPNAVKEKYGRIDRYDTVLDTWSECRDWEVPAWNKYHERAAFQSFFVAGSIPYERPPDTDQPNRFGFGQMRSDLSPEQMVSLLPEFRRGWVTLYAIGSLGERSQSNGASNIYARNVYVPPRSTAAATAAADAKSSAPQPPPPLQEAESRLDRETEWRSVGNLVNDHSVGTAAVALHQHQSGLPSVYVFATHASFCEVIHFHEMTHKSCLVHPATYYNQPIRSLSGLSGAGTETHYFVSPTYGSDYSHRFPVPIARTFPAVCALPEWNAIVLLGGTPPSFRQVTRTVPFAELFVPPPPSDADRRVITGNENYYFIALPETANRFNRGTALVWWASRNMLIAIGGAKETDATPTTTGGGSGGSGLNVIGLSTTERNAIGSKLCESLQFVTPPPAPESVPPTPVPAPPIASQVGTGSVFVSNPAPPVVQRIDGGIRAAKQIKKWRDFGGCKLSADTKPFLGTINAWAPFAPLNRARMDATAVVVDDTVFVFGGRSGRTAVSSRAEMEIADATPNTRPLTAGSETKTPESGGNDKSGAASGGDAQLVHSVERFDELSGRWVVCKSVMPQPRLTFCPVLL